MLQNELRVLDDDTGYPKTREDELAAAGMVVKAAWDAAIFSAAGQEVLIRYFRFHQQQLVGRLNSGCL